MLSCGFLALEQRREKEVPVQPGKKDSQPPRITVPGIRRALQPLLRPSHRPDCDCCNPLCRPYRSKVANLNGVVLKDISTCAVKRRGSSDPETRYIPPL